MSHPSYRMRQPLSRYSRSDSRWPVKPIPSPRALVLIAFSAAIRKLTASATSEIGRLTTLETGSRYGLGAAWPAGATSERLTALATAARVNFCDSVFIVFAPVPVLRVVLGRNGPTWRLRIRWGPGTAPLLPGSYAGAG